ncbi:MAG: Uncharacterized protein CEO19_150 [Parcubacteria group bacterium Gr01-1014_73]|nr:MAG: Uncharacterized protein CEO19_150 [Parcubacteria group bacterium Gr01-1014_73]
MSLYFQHPERAVEIDGRFKHVMAIALDPRTNFREGVVRCITSREGDVAIKGFTDRSILAKVRGDSLEHFEIGEQLKIKNEKEIVGGLLDAEHDFIGLEDPDIWIDEKNDLLHLYFTLPMIGRRDKNGVKISNTFIHLGHAIGKDLDYLEMTEPTLVADENGYGAKELSIAPINRQNVRLNLVESSIKGEEYKLSTVRVAIAESMEKPWKFGETVFNPEKEKISWIGGHASPGPLFPKTFIDVGKDKLLGIINGREANKKVGGETLYGIFSVGLFIYDYENGKIDWVSPEPFIRDSEARTITFASQFVETGKEEGILYAHVDDSFVRAYDLKAESIKNLLP